MGKLKSDNLSYLPATTCTLIVIVDNDVRTDEIASAASPILISSKCMPQVPRLDLDQTLFRAQRYTSTMRGQTGWV
jgi:hypothetical protein